MSTKLLKTIGLVNSTRVIEYSKQQVRHDSCIGSTKSWIFFPLMAIVLWREANIIYVVEKYKLGFERVVYPLSQVLDIIEALSSVILNQ